MTATPDDDGKIVCKIDNARVHSIQMHIKRNHPEWTIERYMSEFPDEPILSKKGEDHIRKKRAELEESAKTEGQILMPLHQVFGLPSAKTVNARGDQLMCSTIARSSLDAEAIAFIPAIDPDHVFTIDLVRAGLQALQLNLPGLFWGLHGSGKTKLWEQLCARTGRPLIRVQHTINTEEAHILGQWTVRDGATVFNLGPLAEAMLKGWAYLADEYDFALPSVTSVYQPVLEGGALVIKDAPPEYRVIKPHRNFRFLATGNTNGIGDETGLYQGTQIQNAANYSRFGVTEEVKYPEPKVEEAIIAGKASIRIDEARKLVDFATEWRKSFVGGQVSSTVSPRELITAAKLAVVRGSDWVGGLKLAFANRLSRTDKEVAEQYMQRLFG